MTKENNPVTGHVVKPVTRKINKYHAKSLEIWRWFRSPDLCLISTINTDDSPENCGKRKNWDIDFGNAEEENTARKHNRQIDFVALDYKNISKAHCSVDRIMDWSTGH